MTQDDLDTAAISGGRFYTVTVANSNEDADPTVTAGVDIAFTIPEALWDAATASAADAAVLVAWLDSKRPA